MSTTAKAGFELRGEGSKLRPMLREIWADRTLIRLLAKKSFLVQYRRASFGILWAVGLPLVQALVMAVVIGRFVRFETGIRYSVFVLSGIVPWSFFLSSVSLSTVSIVDGSGLATKVYFPRAIFPIVTVWTGTRGLVPALGILIGFAAVFKAPLGLHLLLLIPAVLLMLSLATGFSLVFAALHVYFRDMKFIVAASTIPWFWGSGIFYPITIFKSVRQWFELNPAVGMLQLFRSAFGGGAPAGTRSVVISIIWVIALIGIALPLYRRYDRVFVDLM